MTRFDSPALLTAWEAGQYPAIHDAIFNTIAATVPPGARVLDLGACTGLLTSRLQKAGYVVTAAEGNMRSYRAGLQAGTWGAAPVWTQYVTPGTLEGFMALLEDRDVDVIAARRVTPEVHDSMGDSFYQFIDAITGSRVRTIILEGRKPSRKTVHPLGSADAEAAAYGPYWRVTDRAGDVRVLERAF